MKKKKNRKKIIVIVVTTAILLSLMAMFLHFTAKLLSKDNHYKIEPRSEIVEEYKEKLKQYDVDGWLKVQGTNIDYPIIFDNANTEVGEIIDDFVWEREKAEELLPRTVILGHNIKNVSSTPLITNKNHTRFEQLMSFIYYDFAKENQYIQYTKNGKDYLFQIFSISFIEEKDLIQTGYLSTEELKEYIDNALNDSYFKYDIEVNENDKIITLLTCTRFFEGTTSYRFKIEGKLLEEKEEAKLTKVTKKESYKEIEKIMKGGESNEKQA